MHPNPVFRREETIRSLLFARDRGFGTLAVNGDEGPLLAHIPFLLDADGARADLHLLRSNPIARTAEGPAVISVTGPDGYVSPDWYGVDDQVPTWNYVAVHLRGRLERLDTAALEDMIARQSAAMEAMIDGKTPWTMDKMTPGVAERMMRAIVPFRLHVERIDGTWKLNQNKPDAARLAAADRIGCGRGVELDALARLMRAQTV